VTFESYQGPPGNNFVGGGQSQLNKFESTDGGIARKGGGGELGFRNGTGGCAPHSKKMMGHDIQRRGSSKVAWEKRCFKGTVGETKKGHLAVEP